MSQLSLAPAASDELTAEETRTLAELTDADARTPFTEKQAQPHPTVACA